MQPDEEQDGRHRNSDTDIVPVYDRLLIAPLPGVSRSHEDGEDGGNHAYGAQCGGNCHVADDDAEHHSGYDGLAGYLLGNLVRGS